MLRDAVRGDEECEMLRGCKTAEIKCARTRPLLVRRHDAAAETTGIMTASAESRRYERDFD
jgi:hypothetical protein